MPTLKVTWYATYSTYDIIDWVLNMEFKTKIKLEINAAIKMKNEIIY